MHFDLLTKITCLSRDHENGLGLRADRHSYLNISSAVGLNSVMNMAGSHAQLELAPYLFALGAARNQLAVKPTTVSLLQGYRGHKLSNFDISFSSYMFSKIADHLHDQPAPCKSSETVRLPCCSLGVLAKPFTWLASDDTDELRLSFFGIQQVGKQYRDELAALLLSLIHI